MKSMTCAQLGGACDTVFSAGSFDEIAEQSKAHGMEMYRKNDVPHMEAMVKMSEMMKNPEAMKTWVEERHKEFDSLPEHN